MFSPLINFAYADTNGAASAPSTFSDVSTSDWFYTYVSSLSQNGVIKGYPDGSFQPNSTVTCGEALKLILLAAGYKEQPPTGKNWASGYLSFAATKGFVDYSTVTELDAPISRLQIAQIAAKTLGLYKSDTKSPFNDTNDGYVISLYKKGIIQGSYNDDSMLIYNPVSRIKRSEISAIIWRINNITGTLSSGISGGPDSNTSVITDGKTNKIQFGSYTLDVLKNVPANTYDASSFSISNGFITYNSQSVKTCAGIDVSSFQGNIDWAKVKASGIDFAIIRVGYRGYETGSINLDDKFEANIRGALAAGVKVGVYFFSQAITADEAVQEANFVLSHIKNYNITYPVVFDWELLNADTARTNSLNTDTLCQCSAAFYKTISNAGYKTMIYFNAYGGYIKYDLSRVLNSDFWLAEYSDTPSFYYNFHMWQYSSCGSVGGIAGNVDMDICFKTYN